MSKVSNALNMYFILMSRGRVTGKELAEELEVSQRMISTYKDDLELAGLYVGSDKGRYGGYYLEEAVDLNKIHISERERDSLNIVREITKNSNQPYSRDFEMLASKLLSYNETATNVYYAKKNIKDREENIKEQELFIVIKDAILHRNKLKIKYAKMGKNERIVEDRIVDPYGTFNYRNDIYLCGLCNNRDDFRYFKFSRILEISKLKDSFTKRKDFSLDEMLNKSFGIYQDEELEIELVVKYPSSELIKEKTYVENQKIEEFSDGSINFKAKMRGKIEIISWIKSMGSDVEVMKPESLRDEIIKDLEETLSLYK